MANGKHREFILFKTDALGPEPAAVADQVRAMTAVKLLGQSHSGLLVSGDRKSVKDLADRLPGWQSEVNGKAR